MKVCEPVVRLGDQCSLDIYLWHFLIGMIIKDILTVKNAPGWVIGWCLQVIVIIVSIIFSIILYRFKKTKILNHDRERLINSGEAKK